MSNSFVKETLGYEFEELTDTEKNLWALWEYDSEAEYQSAREGFWKYCMDFYTQKNDLDMVNHYKKRAIMVKLK